MALFGSRIPKSLFCHIWLYDGSNHTTNYKLFLCTIAIRFNLPGQNFNSNSAKFSLARTQSRGKIIINNHFVLTEVSFGIER